MNQAGVLHKEPIPQERKSLSYHSRGDSKLFETKHCFWLMPDGAAKECKLYGAGIPQSLTHHEESPVMCSTTLELLTVAANKGFSLRLLLLLPRSEKN